MRLPAAAFVWQPRRSAPAPGGRGEPGGLGLSSPTGKVAGEAGLGEGKREKNRGGTGGERSCPGGAPRPGRLPGTVGVKRGGEREEGGGGGGEKNVTEGEGG